MSQPTYLRHAPRHLARTIEDRIRTQLGALGWFGPGIPFGTTPVTIYSRRIKDSELVTLTGNIVGIFLGRETDDEPQEMGGGLVQSTTDLFIDVIAVNDPVGLALAADIKDFLSGIPYSTSRIFRLNDYVADPAGVPRADYRVEIVDVARQRPDNTETRMFWQVLVAGLEMTHLGSE